MSVNLLHGYIGSRVVGLTVKGSGSVLVTVAGDGVIECGDTKQVCALSPVSMQVNYHASVRQQVCLAKGPESGPVRGASSLVHFARLARSFSKLCASKSRRAARELLCVSLQSLACFILPIECAELANRSASPRVRVGGGLE